MLSHIAPSVGKILISEPFMLDPNFKRSVVLLVEHGDEGSVGLVWNQPTELVVSDILENFPEFKAKVHIGGPVEPDTLHYIHTIGDVLTGAKEILSGVFWGGDFEILRAIIKSGDVNPNEVIFFIGYSGWDPTQLEEEIEQNSWIVSDTSKENLFADTYDDFWKNTVKSLGNKYAHIANFPENPSWN